MSIESMLAAVSRHRKSHPLSTNAYDLLSKGHITSEEYQQVHFGEEAALMAEQRERVENGSGILLPESGLPENIYVPSNVVEALEKDFPADKKREWNQILKDAVTCIDKLMAESIPNQIDHVVIRAKRSKDIRWDMVHSAGVEIRLTLINIKKETVQTVGTLISIPLTYCMHQKDEEFIRELTFTTQRLFQLLVQQLIHAIKTDTIDQIGRE